MSAKRVWVKAAGGRRIRATVVVAEVTDAAEPYLCLKVKYERRSEAETAGREHRQRAYKWPLCRAWHLTKRLEQRRS